MGVSGSPRLTRLTVLGPLVLLANLLLLLGGKVVDNVEELANLLGRLALDEVGDRLAADVNEGLDVHVVGGEDDLKEHLLVDLDKLAVPLSNLGGLAARVISVVRVVRGERLVLVVLAVLEHLVENRRRDVREGDGLVAVAEVWVWLASWRHDGDNAKVPARP